MSYQNFKMAMDLAKRCKFYKISGGKSEEEIVNAEQILGIKFSKQCVEFYREYGYLSFFGNEFFGIDVNDKSGILEGNSVAYTLNDRKMLNLPKEWIPFYNFGNGYMAYFDYSSLNFDGEPQIIASCHNGRNCEKAKVLSEDFGDFVLQMVQEQLAI